MANWQILKAAIADVIKTNGNQEITGQVLQNVLNNIISNLGANATFAGIATPGTNPGTPDQNVFYIASENGVYSNFGGIEIDGEVVVLVNSNGTWVKKNTGIAQSEELQKYKQVYVDGINFFKELYITNKLFSNLMWIRKNYGTDNLYYIAISNKDKSIAISSVPTKRPGADGIIQWYYNDEVVGYGIFDWENCNYTENVNNVFNAKIKDVAYNIEYSPAIKSYINKTELEQQIQNVETELEQQKDVKAVIGRDYKGAHFTAVAWQKLQTIEIKEGEKIYLNLIDNYTGIGCYVYFRTNEDDPTAAMTIVDLKEKTECSFVATANLNYISVNCPSSAFGDTSHILDWRKTIVVSKSRDEGIQGQVDNLQTKIIPLFNGYSLPKNPNELKILCLANSYVQESSEALLNWLLAYSMTNVLFAFTYHAGCSLQMYDENFENNYVCFSYTRNGEAFRTINITTGEDSPLSTDAYVNTPKQAVQWEEWDIIILQQSSYESGKVQSLYPYLQNLIGKIRYNCKNSGLKLGWHMTWAWAKTYPELISIYNTQEEMLDGIRKVAKEVIEKFGLDLVIPSGNVLQKLREVDVDFWGVDYDNVSGLNDSSIYGDFTRDGSHPSLYTRYAIMGAFMQRIILPAFNKTILGSSAVYSFATTGKLADKAIECVLLALNEQF